MKKASPGVAEDIRTRAVGRSGKGRVKESVTGRAALSSAPETETEKVGGGARILKYERPRCARPSSAANSIGHASPNYSSSSHSAAADWLEDDAFYEFRIPIGCNQPWMVDPSYQKSLCRKHPRKHQGKIKIKKKGPQLVKMTRCAEEHANFTSRPCGTDDLHRAPLSNRCIMMVPWASQVRCDIPKNLSGIQAV
ncbi:hypothetical protein BO78DRAFT_226278 [Aspergillus sclerotiicarbonarius CBS 121057]|uniref:Uncharacterized protein n=1 Tax=Aspergillus sclerotiicarbonarius (strain CBS 121057 / IBT 28362) TaxID=1448318 RepID=A0A319EEG8_ASPSB|nr:hypothetical protein BO78DRAFT_226278 [Aspergillus sclerotiicarbonarius CBS 121057]